MLLKYQNDTIFKNVPGLKLKQMAIARVIGRFVLPKMVDDINVTNILYFYKLVDYLLLELYKFVTSPSILWTPTFYHIFI